MSGILVVFEQHEGHISRIGWEALAAGQRLSAQLGLPVSAAVIGADTESLKLPPAPSPKSSASSTRSSPNTPRTDLPWHCNNSSSPKIQRM
jgi:hypothetical protein